METNRLFFIVLLVACASLGGYVGYQYMGLMNDLSKTSIPTTNDIEKDPLAITIAYDKEHLSVNVTPTPEPKYVLCSDYVKITDRYKTPNGFYIVAGNETIALSEEEYNKTEKGLSVKIERPGVYYDPTVPGFKYWRMQTTVSSMRQIKPVSEAESGYRDACEVVA